MSYVRVTETAELANFTVPDPDTGEPVSVIAPDEVLLSLDSGEYVAASVSAYRTEHTGGRTIAGHVRWLSSDGQLMTDALNRPVLSQFTHTASIGHIESLGEPAIKREILLMLLGEPPTLFGGDPIIRWPDEVRSGASIRSAIASAQFEGPQYDVQTLL